MQLATTSEIIYQFYNSVATAAVTQMLNSDLP